MTKALEVCLRWTASLIALVPALAIVTTGAPLLAQATASDQVAQRSVASGPLSTEAIAARALPATVTILTFDAAGDTLGFGSGFLVRASGVIVTNFHVMAGAQRATVILTSGERYDRVEALDHDVAADLAILKVPGYGLPTLTATATLPPVGAKLVAVGNPLGLTRTVSEGIVSAVRMVKGRQLLQMSAAISPGSSGGPVLNGRGEVVAVATSYLESGQSLNFAVPMRYAMGLADASRKPVSLGVAFGEPTRRDGKRTDASVAPDRSERDSRPARTARPRADVLGTWELAQRVVREDGAMLDFNGFMFLGENDLGLIAIMPEGKRTRRVLVLAVQSHNAARDGRITITTKGLTLDGYQTDEGFYLEGDADGDRGALAVAAVATPGELPLSNNSGLYDVQARTWMHFEDLTPSSVRWTGEAAVVIANDSIYVDLFMTNDSGGTTSATGSDALRDGRFDIANDDERLTGSVVNGQLRFEWKDVREWGRYEGTVIGRRQ
jgi:S1-C subfamily serine protease